MKLHGLPSKNNVNNLDEFDRVEYPKKPKDRPEAVSLTVDVSVIRRSEPRSSCGKP